MWEPGHGVQWQVRHAANLDKHFAMQHLELQKHSIISKQYCWTYPFYNARLLMMPWLDIT
jgi:hypothetical protein